MSEIKYTELDFFKIKENLKNFLKTQDKFKDYNFDGSSLSILLDVLSYNTAYNAFYLNMLASEMFLDSASLRESVLSRAKHLGYTPRSVQSLTASVDLSFLYASSVAPKLVYIDRTNEFYSTINGVKYSFVPKNSTILTNSTTETISGTQYTKFTTNLQLIQGKRLTHSYTVDTSKIQKFIIPNENVDLSTLIVTVKSGNSSASSVYKKFDDINVLTSTDEVYFVQSHDSLKYEIVFGDGVFGKALTSGEIITLDYIVSSGDAALGANKFDLTNRSAYPSAQIFVTTKSNAKDYVDVEDESSIKYLAPKWFESQNRAVTKSDYETILKKDIPIIEHIRIWGGEETEPPVYGKIFCAIKPISGFALNTEDKKRLIDTYINPRKILSLDVEILEPEYINLIVDCTVNCFLFKTNNNKDAIQLIVDSAIKNFRQQFLSGFDSDFRHSKLLRFIDLSEPSIESNLTNIKIKYKIIPPLDSYFNYEIQLNNSIDTGDASNGISAIDSSEFVYQGTKVKISDNGLGKLQLYYFLNSTKIIVNDNIGTVNYDTGKININNLIVDSIAGDNKISLIIKPKENDIISLRNQILILDDSDISVTVVDLSTKKLS